jgi:hypothetical protein
MRRLRLLLRASFFTLYLAVQITVPAVQIFRGQSAFRWGMFADSGERHEIFAEYADGSHESLDQIRARTGRGKLLRSEVNPGQRLLGYLCSQTPKPVMITVRNVRTAVEERYRCP